MKFELDIYLGSGVEPEPKETIEVRSTREGISACRQSARRIWGRVVRWYPEDDGVVSFGPPDDHDGYVTLRRVA